MHGTVFHKLRILPKNDISDSFYYLLWCLYMSGVISQKILNFVLQTVYALKNMTTMALVFCQSWEVLCRLCLLTLSQTSPDFYVSAVPVF